MTPEAQDAYQAGFQARTRGFNVLQAESAFVCLQGEQYLAEFQDGYADGA